MSRGVSDQALLSAVRQRILAEIQKKQEQHHAAITNNVYGHGGGTAEQSQHGMSQGVADQLGNSTNAEDPYDYFVDITREDLPNINPATGKPAGWKKSVQRYRTKKGEPEPGKKKILKDGP